MTPVECRFRGKAKRRRDHRRVVAVCGRQPKGSESEPLELSPITLKDIGDKKLSARARKLGERRRDHPTDQELFSGAAAPIINPPIGGFARCHPAVQSCTCAGYAVAAAGRAFWARADSEAPAFEKMW